MEGLGLNNLMLPGSEMAVVPCCRRNDREDVMINDCSHNSNSDDLWLREIVNLTSFVDPLDYNAADDFYSSPATAIRHLYEERAFAGDEERVSTILSNYDHVGNVSCSTGNASSGESENYGSYQSKKVVTDFHDSFPKRNHCGGVHQQTDSSTTDSGNGSFQINFSKKPKVERHQARSNNIDFRQGNHGSGSETDVEAVTHVKEMIYRAAALRPVCLGVEESVEKPKRRNVRISSDPQTVAARHRRERISERLRVLQKLVPGGNKMDTASMLDEAANYLKFLKSQVSALDNLGIKPIYTKNTSSSSSSTFNSSYHVDLNSTVFQPSTSQAPLQQYITASDIW